MEKKRCLLLIFPVWADFSHDKYSPDVSGFWADIAVFFSYILQGGYFALLPYEENGCNNWYEAIIKKYRGD